MILLSFSSAAKYIISMMLAVLGIISYEDIQVPEQPAKAAHQAYVIQHMPIDPVMHKTLDSDNPFGLIPAEQQVPAFIPARFDHESSLQSQFKHIDYVRCTVDAAVLKEAESFGQIIILVRDLEAKLKESTVSFSGSGI